MAPSTETLTVPHHPPHKARVWKGKGRAELQRQNTQACCFPGGPSSGVRANSQAGENPRAQPVLAGRCGSTTRSHVGAGRSGTAGQFCRIHFWDRGVRMGGGGDSEGKKKEWVLSPSRLVEEGMKQQREMAFLGLSQVWVSWL